MNNLSIAQRNRRRRSIPITDYLLEVLNGSLLGDGNLHSPVGFQAVYHQDSSQSEFIDYVANILKDNDYLSTTYDYDRFDKRTGKTYHSYSVNSVFTVELQEQRNNWYPCGVKIVPPKLELTSIMVSLWYLGDGNKSKEDREVRLSTDAFTVNDIELLVSKLNNVGICSTRLKSKNCIYIKAKSYDTFFDYIGDCPIACYDYKFPRRKVCVS